MLDIRSCSGDSGLHHNRFKGEQSTYGSHKREQHLHRDCESGDRTSR